MHDVYFSHRSHHTASPSDLWEATHASSIFFPQIPSYHITIWPPGGHSCIMYIFPTDPIIPHHHLASRRPLMHHVYFPTGLITLHHHLASRRPLMHHVYFPTGLITLRHHLASRGPLMHHVYFSHRSHHTASPSDLWEGTHA